MLHLAPEPPLDNDLGPYAEVAARLAGIRHTLQLVDPFGGGPASDPSEDERMETAWNAASDSKRRSFDRRSGRVVAATAAALEALLAEQAEGREPNAAASRKLAEEIRAGLADVSRLMLGRSGSQPIPADAFPAAL